MLLDKLRAMNRKLSIANTVSGKTTPSYLPENSVPTLIAPNSIEQIISRKPATALNVCVGRYRITPFQ